MASESKSVSDCKPCKRKLPVTERGSNAGLLTGLLLALLPKCPFCMIAYSGTVVLCGKGGSVFSSHTISSEATFYSSLVLCGIILTSILLNNRKDARTGYAFLLAILGTAGVLLSVTRGGGQLLYYLSVMTIFGAVWLNGSLHFFVSRLRAFLKDKPAPVHQ